MVGEPHGTGAAGADGAATGRLAAAVAALRERPIDPIDKGFGRQSGLSGADGPDSPDGPVTTARLARRRPSLFGGEIDLPLMVLRETALAHNIEAMAAYCAAAGVRHAPHGKTPMAPQLMARQLAAGAWAISAATIAQAQVYRAFGVPRILIASQLTDPAAVRWLSRELAADPGFDAYVCADSLAGVALLDDALREAGTTRPLRVLAELGYPGGRTGARTMAEALAVARAVRASERLELAGATGYEGGIHRDDLPATLAAVAAFCADLRGLGEQLPAPRPGGMPPRILSAGGSSFFDVACRELTATRPGAEPADAVIRSGAYITHDHGHYAETSPACRPASARPAAPAGVPLPVFAPAIEVWAAVLSVPETGLAILNAGRRDISCDQGMPVPLRVRPAGGDRAAERDAAGMRVVKLDDQHAYLNVPADAGLVPGDLVSLGSTHPCTTFELWRAIAVVDEQDRVIDVVRTFF